MKVNPDAPQLPVRRAALEAGKIVLMPGPRLRTGFVLIDPGRIGRLNLKAAASISGAFRYGRELDLDDLPRPIHTRARQSRPQGLLWDHITDDMLEEMPLLQRLAERRRRAGS